MEPRCSQLYAAPPLTHPCVGAGKYLIASRLDGSKELIEIVEELQLARIERG
jgi:hypothetical protein